IIAVIGLAFVRVALLQRLGDIFTNRASPRAIRILPGQAVMFSRAADDSLGILINLGVVMLFRRVIVLRLDEPMANLDRIQLVSADPPIENFLTTGPCIEGPLRLVFYQRNRKGKVVVADRQSGAVRILLIYFDRFFFLPSSGKRNRSVLVCDGILRANDI